MSDNIFDLVYTDSDWSEHYFFDGPESATESDFVKVCMDLLPGAGYRSVLDKKKKQEFNWISWTDVVESLIPLLERQGYQRVFIDSFTIEGGGIVGLYDYKPPNDVLGFSGRLIVNHNKKLEERMAKDREERKKGLKLKRTVQIIK